MGNTDIVGDVRGLIVFDLDGTLIDSRGDLADAANALISERGGTRLSEETIGRMVGDGAAALVRRALTAAALPLDESSLPRFLELYNARLLRTTRPYAGITDALEAVKQHGVLAVLTNKPLAPTERILTAFDLAPFFATVIGGDGPFARKPDPQGLRRLIVEHSVPVEKTIMVGDSRIDAATAHAAGAHFCWARYGFGAADVTPSPPVSADRPADLPAAIVALLK